MKPKVDGSVGSAIFTLVEGLVFIALGIAVNHSFLADVQHDQGYALGKLSLDILKIKNLFNNVAIAFFGFLVVASVLPPTAVRKNVPFFYAIYILITMIVAVFMIAGIAVYTTLYLNIKDYGKQPLSNAGKVAYRNRYSGTLAMLIVYSIFFFLHCVCTAYSIYHYFTWRVNMQRWTQDMEPSAMYYHDGMVNASYMQDGSSIDPRYFWPPPFPPRPGQDFPPGGAFGPPPGAFGPPPPGYSYPFTPQSNDKPETSSSNQRSEASTNTPTHTEVGTTTSGAEAAASGAEAAANGAEAAASGAEAAASGAEANGASSVVGECSAGTQTVVQKEDLLD